MFPAIRQRYQETLTSWKKNYEVKTIIPFDLFPNTPLVESITVLQRRGTTDRKPGKSIKRKHKHAKQAERH